MRTNVDEAIELGGGRVVGGSNRIDGCAHAAEAVGENGAIQRSLSAKW